MTAIALLIFLPLEAVALFHLYWAYGGLWPGQSEAQLVERVVGVEHGQMPPRGLTMIVALGIALAGLWPALYLALIPSPLPRWLIGVGMWSLAGIFLARGAVTYVPGVWPVPRDLPFYRLNRRYFSPLILAIGVGYLSLLLA